MLPPFSALCTGSFAVEATYYAVGISAFDDYLSGRLAGTGGALVDIEAMRLVKPYASPHRVRGAIGWGAAMMSVILER